MARGAWLVFGAGAALLSSSVTHAQGAAPVAPPAPRGVAVVLVGAATPEATARCESVARSTYARSSLTPSIAEDVAGTLCGGDVDAGSEGAAPTPAARATRELRAALAAPFEGVAQQALLVALAKEVGALGLVLVEPTGSSTTLSLLHRVNGPTDASGPSALTADPLRFELPFVARADAPDGPDEASAFEPAARAFEELLAAPPCERSAGGETALRSCPGAAPLPAGSADFAWWTYEEPKQGGASLIDSPWFWIAAGGVGALGLTVLIVSQTTDVDVGTVHVDGSVPK